MNRWKKPKQATRIIINFFFIFFKFLVYILNQLLGLFFLSILNIVSFKYPDLQRNDRHHILSIKEIFKRFKSKKLNRYDIYMNFIE